MMNLMRPIGVALVLVLAWFVTPLGWIPQAFLKHQNVQFGNLYPIIFFILFMVLLLIGRSWVEGVSWSRALLVCTLTGHLLSFFSIFTTILFVPGEFEKISSKLLEALAVYFVFPGPMLGGAVFGFLGALGLRLTKKYLPNHSNG